MAISKGDRLPEGRFTVMGADGPAPLSTQELFAGKKVVLFSVPGAFTPTCSARHLPGFIEQADRLREKGVDTVACMAVNDVFVMDAWGRHAGCGDRVLMLADGSADYTRALGLEADASRFGMGVRGQRFALVADDGVVTALYVDKPGAFEVSSVEHVLEQL